MPAPEYTLDIGECPITRRQRNRGNSWGMAGLGRGRGPLLRLKSEGFCNTLILRAITLTLSRKAREFAVGGERLRAGSYANSRNSFLWQ
jgi:hypothetical protein